ncbi:hypothetical protein PISMIDRAFT_10717 [Pisolithus microcarpus 441]|uniref:Unplaced genomic scaffold scaffold_39, whole genome shotgun sequence n=1 Tax=Pisolithus microcarpus 441 TaxID=765257 RepID=A0A0C9ZVQ8_9AGAM|nr:hypothetical protein PISMIDRAFT_10717 [Pisolithus microcarpus 441]
MLAGLASMDNLPVPSDPVLCIDDGPATTVNRSVHTLIDLPTFDVLQTDPPSPSTSSSPTHAPPILKCDELDKHLRSPVPAASNTLVSVPLGSPLMDLACLDEAHTSVRVDSRMEWCGYAVYPLTACANCIGAKTVCSGIDGIKCARCKIRHLVCSLYKDTAEGRAHVKALVAGKTPVKNQASTSGTPATVKPNPGMKHSARPKKRVWVEASLPSPSASGSNEVPRLTMSTPPSSSSDPSINFTLILRSVLVAAVEALDQSLQDQGVSEKVFGKHRARD